MEPSIRVSHRPGTGEATIHYTANTESTLSVAHIDYVKGNLQSASMTTIAPGIVCMVTCSTYCFMTSDDVPSVVFYSPNKMNGFRVNDPHDALAKEMKHVESLYKL